MLSKLLRVFLGLVSWRYCDKHSFVWWNVDLGLKLPPCAESKLIVKPTYVRKWRYTKCRGQTVFELLDPAVPEARPTTECPKYVNHGRV